MKNKIKTVKLKGGEYAKVPERIKRFREDCPNGTIETSPEFHGENVLFRTYVRKDKGDDSSADATGHAVGKIDGDKAFEKLETISVGRALANLGYIASGEVASSEEMERFLKYQKQEHQKKVNAAIEDIKSMKSIEELRKYWLTLGALIKEKDVQDAKDQVKKRLTEKSKN